MDWRACLTLDDATPYRILSGEGVVRSNGARYGIRTHAKSLGSFHATSNINLADAELLAYPLPPYAKPFAIPTGFKVEYVLVELSSEKCRALLPK